MGDQAEFLKPAGQLPVLGVGKHWVTMVIETPTLGVSENLLIRACAFRFHHIKEQPWPKTYPT